MNLYVLGTCIFQRIQLINHVTGDVIPGSERGYGFLSRETDYGVTPDYRQCTWYPSSELDEIFDGWMQMGRIFAFLSAILAAVCFCVLLLTCCVAFSPSMFERWLFWMYIMAAICICLAFLIFGSEYCSENACKVADGSGWAISAFMFHLVSANTVKSFAAAAPKRGMEEEEDLNDEELDDLYYENEADKYPPPHPDGPRGVIIGKNGQRTYDNGDDYYDDKGRLIDPYNERRVRGDDPEQKGLLYDDDELEDISDHDLEDYAESDDSDDDEEEEAQYDDFGNPIYHPDNHHLGNLGVGYENNEAPVQYDEYGNPLVVDYHPHQQQPFSGDDVDESGNPIHYYDPHPHDGTNDNDNDDGPTFA